GDAKVYHSDPSVPVIVEGETGTGKEIVARMIHFGELGSELPFVDLNCSAIPGELFENERFGYEEGAFTGGRRDGAPGKLEAAGEGTIFLDEVGEMPLDMQPKLLRVLESRNYYRVGGTRKMEFRARVVCATNRRLEDEVEAGRFRMDLYHRLRIGYIRIPPLRQRREEILPLAGYFLEREAHKKRKHFKSISAQAVDLFMNHPWPGNVRELENTIERAVLMYDGDELLPAHLEFFGNPAGTPANGHPSLASDLGDLDSLKLPEGSLDFDRLTDAIIRKALEKCGGNKTKAAEYLGMSRGAFRNRLNNL
ncbi:MAG: sigma-54-dependent Fis family transcriptional regulator, partial [Planctomycetes bacterium]|nr:sigma-54-dependent Fis family transcriptional regulator [Planctomycetota bacterium]